MINTTERTYLSNLLKESETKLIAALENTNDEDFVAKPFEDRWSLAMLVEHIMITDKSLLRGIYKQAAKELGDDIPKTSPDEKVAKAAMNRTIKVKAPSFLEPKGIFKTKKEAFAAFRKNRAVIEEFVATTDLPLEKIAFKHFVFGLLNGKNWIAFMAAHCNRHIEQIKEAL
ncbi:MAG: DinB family protein [Chitinophagales bacterium]